ncbi:MAG: hypothetical protein IPL03_02180 [Sterolibacteriaceae bacterium]|nr:hypothetical protein [Candidatus Methylophosphatis haderslevensis]
MTICPIAVVAGCRKCPAYSICPLKTVLGDAAKPDKDADATAKPAPRADASRRQKK